MNAKILLLTLFAGVLLMSSCDSVNSTTATLKNENDTASYYIGYMYGTGILRTGIQDANMKAIVAGMNSAIEKKDIKVSQQEMQMFLSKYLRQMAERKAEENLKRGKVFMEENAKKSGVDTLPNGIQYKVLKKGDGPKPTATDRVKVHYTGTLIDGTEFDSSVKRGQPTEFPVNGVIQGWKEALQEMPVGSKWMIYIPSEMAYGPRGAGGIIGPNETLIFEVELLDITTPNQSEDGNEAGR